MHRRLARRRLKKIGTATVCVLLLAALVRPERPSVVSGASAPMTVGDRSGIGPTRPTSFEIAPLWRPAGDILRRAKTTAAPAVPFISAAQQREQRESLRRWNLIFRLSSQYRIKPDLARRIHDAAIAEGIEPDLGFRLVRVESRFQPHVISPAGAIGLTQVMLGTARQFDRRLTREALLDPDVNLRIGFRFLRRLIEDYNGNLQLALLVYNRGPVAVQRALSQGLDPTNGYEHLVMRGYRGRGVLD